MFILKSWKAKWAFLFTSGVCLTALKFKCYGDQSSKDMKTRLLTWALLSEGADWNCSGGALNLGGGAAFTPHPDQSLPFLQTIKSSLLWSLLLSGNNITPILLINLLQWSICCNDMSKDNVEAVTITCVGLTVAQALLFEQVFSAFSLFVAATCSDRTIRFQAQPGQWEDSFCWVLHRTQGFAWIAVNWKYSDTLYWARKKGFDYGLRLNDWFDGTWGILTGLPSPWNVQPW